MPAPRSLHPRVVHLLPAKLPPTLRVTGGAERYSLELAQHMAEAVPTRLVAFGDGDLEWSRGALRVRLLGGGWRPRGQGWNPVSSALLTEIAAADVIHCHQQHLLSTSLAALGARLLRRRVFVTDLGGGGWNLSAFISTDRWFHGHLHLSQYSRDVYGHRDAPWAQVILGGVDAAKFSPGEGARGESVLFVGRLLPHKGIHDLIAALPADLPLELIGQAHDPEYLAELHRLAAGKPVLFRHDCDDAALVEAYRRAFCVVLPSVHVSPYGLPTQVPELLGQTVLEAMACGVPVIATRVASLPELVEDGVTGFLVPPNQPAALREKLLWLREQRGAAAAMGEAGRRRARERFTWEATVARCLAAYATGDRRGRAR